ncbi:PREDICTED: tyrosine-protein kinase Srms [Nanorana parkeri]|uniref:tyrosine-protein kinase Srms n=1 Tax=Nanorana parkeri TaxID=125878 RepID=UPI00085485B0|nr:PREDICTED: tyrosine-protein kinase Srms [Nanorana parkeri]
MEGFLREQLRCMVCLWDKIWPPPESLRHPTVAVISPMPTSTLPRMDIVTTLFDFDARTSDELTVNAGEELCKVGDEGEYIMARKLTGVLEMGLVPASYVTPTGFFNTAVTPDSPKVSTLPSPPTRARYQHSISSEPWYVEVTSRHAAERLLLSPPNGHGSYLVRPSDTNPGQYSLSVCNDNKVTHFRIYKDSRDEYYLQHGRSFPTIQDLLIFHKTNWKLLKCPLLQPCVTQVLAPSDTWERPRSEFALVRKLGQGFFGEVHEGLWTGEQRVAIKTFKQEDLNRDDLEKEMNALKTLCHRNLIRLLAVCSIGEPVYLVTELMTKGNLQDYLKGTEGKRLKYPEFIYIICQVADGMEYLEKKHVVHRDLATRNVLVGDNLICKIADFGLARLLKDDLYSPESNRCIPIKWTAPEALSFCKYSTKSDVWSFGVLMYEVYTFGETPYKGWNNRDVFTKVSRGYRLPQPAYCRLEMYNLMLLCWEDKPEERPSFQELVEKLTDIERTIR